MKRLVGIIVFLLIVSILGSSCGVKKDYKGFRKKKVGMGWM